MIVYLCFIFEISENYDFSKFKIWLYDKDVWKILNLKKNLNHQSVSSLIDCSIFHKKGTSINYLDKNLEN